MRDERHTAAPTTGNGHPMAAVLGPAGTFSHFAALEFFSGVFETPAHAPGILLCDTLKEVFDTVSTGKAWFGLAPIENSLDGAYGSTYDLLRSYPIFIRAELFARLRHSLLSRAASLAEVRRVYSHPHVLAQATDWLRTHLPGVPLVSMESTAAAAVRAAAEDGAAAVGHWRLSPITGLYVLIDELELGVSNWTRWVVFTLEDAPPLPAVPMAHSRPLRTMLEVDIANNPGALLEFLRPVAEGGVNLLRLEQRPLPGRWWEDEHFMVLDCDLSAPEHAPLLERLRQASTSVRILGVYREGPRLQTS